MPITLIATSGASDANTYVSLEEANEYFEGRLDAEEWDEISGDESRQIKALVMAARIIDRLNFIGEKESDSQAMEFPRRGGFRARYTEGTSYFVALNGKGFSQGAIPQDIKWAQCEMALHLLANGSEIGGQSILGFSGGGISMQWAPGAASSGLPPHVSQLLAPYVQGVRLVRS